MNSVLINSVVGTLSRLPLTSDDKRQRSGGGSLLGNKTFEDRQTCSKSMGEYSREGKLYIISKSWAVCVIEYEKLYCCVVFVRSLHSK